MPEAPTADVCLLLEGTYPYVLGGVSAWVDQIIKGLPDFTFALYFIGSNKASTAKKHYELPRNVVSLTEVFLHERLPPEELRPARLDSESRAKLYGVLEK